MKNLVAVFGAVIISTLATGTVLAKPEATKNPVSYAGESDASCVRRHMAKFDPVSKIRITQGDAERFCNRSRNRR
jgi:hypothetical protein